MSIEIRSAPRSPKGATLRAFASALALGVGVMALSQPIVTLPAAAQFAAAPASGFADLAEKVKPAVVSISVKSGGAKVASAKRRGGGGGGGGFEGIPGLPDDHPLNEFFRNLPKEFRDLPEGGGGGGRPTLAQGSGYLISADGYVVTNNHVIEGGGSITVTFDSERSKFDAELVGADPRTDVALLKIKSDKTFPFVKFAEKQPRVGDWVIAVGNPFGFGGTVTAGIVSALGRDIGASGPYDYMQIDAAVNRGNSGGPTFNLQGEVVGMNTAIFSPSGGSVGLAFAIPSKTVANVVDALKHGGVVKRGWLGVSIQTIDDDTASSIGLPEATGALINKVTAGGPAQAAGLREQDAILAINGDKIADSRDLARKIAEFQPDTTVDVKVLRGGKEEIVKVKLGQFPTSSEEIAKLETGKPAPSTGGELDLSSLGLTLGPAGKGSKDGVVISDVDNGSDAAAKGLKAGDVIVEVNRQKVTAAAEVEQAVKQAQSQNRQAVLLLVRSGDQTRLVAIRFQATKKG